MRSTLTQTAIALVAGVCALAALLLARFRSTDAALRSLDFNAALFEDFLGPYWRTAQAVAAQSPIPDPQYVYPATLATFIAPLTRNGDGGASWLAAAFGLCSVFLILFGAFTLRAPQSKAQAALMGVFTLTAFPVLHGVYWANAGLLAIGLGVAGWALAQESAAIRSPKLGGSLVGLAAAIKLTPLVLFAGLLARLNWKSLSAAAATLCIVGLLLPLVSLGPEGFATFHEASFGQLRSLAVSAKTSDGGQFSQSLLAVSSRVWPAAAPWLGYALEVAAIAACCVFAQRHLARPGQEQSSGARANAAHVAPALIWMLALPTLLVAPAWLHGLAWLPVAWWFAWTAPPTSIARAAVAASAFLTVFPFSWAFRSPTAYFESGVPALAELLGLVALALSATPKRVDRE